MTSLSALIAFLHFIAGFTVVFTLVYERISFKQQLSITTARQIQKADLIYGISAALVLIIGFLRVFFFEKGSAYYFSNPYFHLKLTLFLIVGLLSIYPTIRFLKWKKFIESGNVVVLEDKEYKRIKLLLNLEVIGLIAMLAAASFMAKGYL
jgi:putative membrane protein